MVDLTHRPLLRALFLRRLNSKMPVCVVYYQYIKLEEDRSASVSKRKRNMGKENFASLRKIYKVLVSGGIFTKQN